MLHGCVTISWQLHRNPSLTSVLYETAQFICSEKQPKGCNLLKLAAVMSWLSYSAWEAGTSVTGPANPPKGPLESTTQKTATLKAMKAVGLSLPATGETSKFLLV